jgi:hypothetical protein
MNAQQPYEKHLADKLQKLKPSGDANSNWPQMKALLDREMPGGGNGGNKTVGGSTALSQFFCLPELVRFFFIIKG